MFQIILDIISLNGRWVVPLTIQLCSILSDPVRLTSVSASYVHMTIDTEGRTLGEREGVKVRYKKDNDNVLLEFFR
jgi:hypothetical protein